MQSFHGGQKDRKSERQGDIGEEKKKEEKK